MLKVRPEAFLITKGTSQGIGPSVAKEASSTGCVPRFFPVRIFLDVHGHLLKLIQNPQ